MSNISVVIPHKNRHGILKMHLSELRRTQFMKDYEVIVVDDHSDSPLPDLPDWVTVVSNPGVGPAAARNYGAEISNSDIVFFVGDDCMPEKNLLFRHFCAHKMSNKKTLAVQGYSPFHPQIASSPFMEWLDRSGIQANWNATRNADGSHKDTVNGFCLTTNYSINRQEFLNLGGFDSKYFKNAAWEDVVFGHIANVFGIETKFDSRAINYHFHSYDINSFIRRQRTVGRNIISLGLKQSDMCAELLKPEEIRFAKSNSSSEYLHAAYGASGDALDDAWGKASRIAMIEGIIEEIDSREIYWKVFEHLHKKESVVHSLEAIRGITDGNYGWTMHNCEWLMQSAPDNWAIYCFVAEVNRHFGNEDMALAMFRKSLEMAPNEWATKNL